MYINIQMKDCIYGRNGILPDEALYVLDAIRDNNLFWVKRNEHIEKSIEKIVCYLETKFLEIRNPVYEFYESMDLVEWKILEFYPEIK